MVETKKTFCRFCHVFCGMEADIDEGRVIAVRGDKDNAVSQGYTCQKGRSEIERIYHPDRLTGAQKRVDGRLTGVDTRQALDEIAGKLRDIIAEHGPHSVAVYVGCGGHRTSAGGPWFVSKWLDAIGSQSMYTSMTIDSPSLFLAGDRFFGSAVPVNLPDVERADVMMFVGTNPIASHHLVMPQSNPLARLRDAQKRGMKLIVVDPRVTDTARRADIHLQVKPGEDATLLAGIIKVILDRGLQDKSYCDDYVSGIDELREAVSDFDLEYVSRRTTVPAELIEAAAVTFATAERGAAQNGTGLTMARHQNLNVQLVMTLNGLCGRYDREGGMVRNRGVLNFDIPIGRGPARFPMYPGLKSRIRDIKASFNLIGMFLEMPTNTLTDEILTQGDGQIRALIVNGGNPALVFSNEGKTVEALKSLDLLVVNDLFESATAAYADYVMAVKHPFEREDVPRLMDGMFPFPFSQYAEALVDGPEDALEEWEIFWELAQRLGVQLPIPGVSMDERPTTGKMIDCLHASSRIPIDEVRKYPGGHVWGERELIHGGVVPSMIGHEDGRMAAGHPDVIEELRQVRAEPTVEAGNYEASDDFGFRLITYRMKEAYCTTGQNLPSLRNKRAYNPVLMNPVSMKSLGVETGDRVKIDSSFGEVVGIVEASDSLAPGVIGLAHGWGNPADSRDVDEKGCNVQRLIPADQNFDSLTGLALQSAVPVNVRPQ